MPSLSPADAKVELERIRRDPAAFVERTWNEEVIGKQRLVFNALARPEIEEIHVKACHAPGKTHTAARATAWWLAAYPHDSIVLTTAPTWSQVEDEIWREIRDGAVKSKVALGGEMLKTAWEFEPKWYAMGIATSPETAVNIQGYHARHVLIIVDEADGVSQRIWDAVDGLTTSAHVVVLAIGNPIDPQSAWRKRYNLALASSSAVCITISADDVLQYTDTGKYPFLLQRKWVVDKKKRWGETSAMYIAKVKAEWPDQGADTLIPISLLMRARNKTVSRGPRGLGCDVARSGVNRTVRTLWAGNQIEWSRALAKENTMETAGRVYADINQYAPVATAVDDTGVGGGVVDRLRELGKAVVAVNNGSQAMDMETYADRGTEMWFVFLRALELDQIGLLCDDMDSIDELIVELNRAKYHIDGKRLKVDKYGLEKGRNARSLTDEEKASRSPDRADSAILGWNAIAQMLPNKPVRIETEIERELREERELKNQSDGSGGWYE